MERGTPSTQPLLRALEDLTAAYSACAERIETLIGALVAADTSRIRAALAEQAASLRAIDDAEVRRKLAVRGLAHSLLGATAQTAGEGAGLTVSALCRMLPHESSAPLQTARHDLLLVLRRLQLLQQRAMSLAHNGQIVIQRTMSATLSAAGGYGATGERAVAGGARTLQGRWA